MSRSGQELRIENLLLKRKARIKNSPHVFLNQARIKIYQIPILGIKKESRIKIQDLKMKLAEIRELKIQITHRDIRRR